MTKTNRIAVVTGGIGGIGSAICVRLAEDGNKVVATYHPSEQEKAQDWLAEMSNKGLDIEIAGGDVSSAEDAAAMMAKIQEEVGNVDILVNCAGITRDSMMKRMDAAKWDAVISTNLSSAFYVTKPVWDGMVERGYGRIINVSSMNGQRGQAGQANYASAKAGMHGFTMTLAQEGAAKGITANTLAPGYVKTPMTDAIREDIREAIIATIPMKRFALPEEIASGVSFLAAEQQAYISGAIIPINGAFFMH